MVVAKVDQEEEQLPLAGYLKWYNPVKGFGFVVEESSKPRYFVTRKCFTKIWTQLYY